MAVENFAPSLAKVLKHEGGYVNHPDDPGGETNKGVTKKVYDVWRQARNLSVRSVKQITDAEVEEIYRKSYWSVNKCDVLPLGVDYCVFDGAVNSGPSRSARWLQAALGVDVDGRVGTETLTAAGKKSPAALITLICDTRLTFLRGLKTWATFGKGWDRRVSEVRRDALAMAGVWVTPRKPPPDLRPTTKPVQPQDVKQTSMWALGAIALAVAVLVAFLILT